MGAFFIFADIRRLRLPKPYAIPSVIGNRCIRSSGCRPEVASDVISGQNVGMVQANIVTKLEDPSSTRLGAIKFAHGRYDDDGDDGVRVSSHYAQTNYVGSGVKMADGYRPEVAGDTGKI